MAFGILTNMSNVPIHIDYRGKHLAGVADPVVSDASEQVPTSHIIYLDGKYFGTLRCSRQGWELDRPADLELVKALGEYLHAWYE